MRDWRFKDLTCLAALTLIAMVPAPGLARQKPNNKQHDNFKREEMVLLKLKTAPKSAQFYILQSLKSTRELQKNIDRSARQSEQADAIFHKATRHPDDRSLSGSVKKLREAEQTAELLEQQLKDAREQLNSEIQNTLVMPTETR